jgi:hypothetical protein
MFPVFVRFSFFALVVALVEVPGFLPAQTPAAGSVHVESTRPVTSPNGKMVVIVDQLQPVDEDGQRDEFSGVLRLRIRPADGGEGPARARQIEAPRVRTVRAPEWLDDRWAVVEYSISRASRGVAYLDTASGRVIQLEIVTATGGRRTEAGMTAGSLANFEVIDSTPDGTANRIVSLTHGHSSLFPLVVRKVPAAGDAAKTREDGASALDDVLTAMTAWEKARTDLSLPGAVVDQATDSISPDGKLMAALACTEQGPRALVLPTEAGTPEEAFAKVGVVALTSGIRLNCGTHEGTEDIPVDGRYATVWETPTTVQILREVYKDESDTPERTPVLKVSLEGGEMRISSAQDARADR